MNKDELFNNLLRSGSINDLLDKKAESVYVVLNKSGMPLKDPGMDQIWRNPNKKIAEKIAKDSGGSAILLSDAIKYWQKK